MIVAKCPVCEQRKPKRTCPALEAVICPLCCAQKRQKEIACPETCPHLGGMSFQLARSIRQEIAETFRSEADDVFQIPEAAFYAMVVERVFVEHFYANRGVDDEHIRDACTKWYLFQAGRTPEPAPEAPHEGIIFDAFRRADEEYPDLPDDLRAKTTLRILRSIQKSSGGALGNRNYLEFIYSLFHSDGRWTPTIQAHMAADAVVAEIEEMEKPAEPRPSLLRRLLGRR
ncbi:MAG: hypothetical protein HY321_15665 [Armatimonadetes bacterium]|nr:hypothetical protein [Armatimonadota bacterium]